MTEVDPLIDANIKTLEEANIITTSTSDLTTTQFRGFTPECIRSVMDSYDIVPGTVVVVGCWEAMRVVGNGERDEKAWVACTLTRSSTHGVI